MSEGDEKRDRRPTVLVVDDEKEVVDAYALKLRREYDVRTAYGGPEALEVVDDAVDVVLLDRRMPELSGDEVLRRIRDRELSCRVVMLTAISPEFDIVGMPFDDYLCKPVRDDDLYDAIDGQLQVAAYEKLSAYFSAAAKRELLEAQLPRTELDAADEYAEVVKRTDRLRTEVAGVVDDFDALAETFSGVDRGPGR
jgi:CheY-like chemotaxis protein